MTTPRSVSPESEIYGGDQHPAGFCPNLGGPREIDTFYLFPSSWNRCYRPEAPKNISENHQAEYCLSVRFRECPVFGQDWDGVFPISVLGRKEEESTRRHNWLKGWRVIINAFVLIFILVLLVTALGFTTQDRWKTVQSRLGFAGETGIAPVLEPTATLVASNAEIAKTEIPPFPTELPVSEPTEAPLTTPVPSPTTRPTSTHVPTPGPGLGTPFGPGGGFVIHVVVAGESYGSISLKYSSSQAAIKSINPENLGTSLWVGQQLVVPIGVTDPEGLPVFAIVQVSETIAVDDLADMHASDADQIRFFNALGEAENVPSGRWMILPIIDSN